MPVKTGEPRKVSVVCFCLYGCMVIPPKMGLRRGVLLSSRTFILVKRLWRSSELESISMLLTSLENAFPSPEALIWTVPSNMWTMSVAFGPFALMLLNWESGVPMRESRSWITFCSICKSAFSFFKADLIVFLDLNGLVDGRVKEVAVLFYIIWLLFDLCHWIL